jgi:hypothetical protein
MAPPYRPRGTAHTRKSAPMQPHRPDTYKMYRNTPLGGESARPPGGGGGGGGGGGSCMDSVRLTNVMLIVLAVIGTVFVVMKAVEDMEAAPIAAEMIQKVRFFEELATWGRGVMHNASAEAVAPGDPGARRRSPIAPPATGHLPEVAVVRDLFELVASVQNATAYLVGSGVVDEASAVMALARHIAESDGARVVGDTVVRVTQHVEAALALDHPSAAHDGEGAPAAGTIDRVAHLVDNADAVVRALRDADTVRKADAAVERAAGLLQQVDEARAVEAVRQILALATTMLRELEAMGVAGRADGLLAKTDALLEEARASIESLLGGGLTVKLGT